MSTSTVLSNVTVTGDFPQALTASATTASTNAQIGDPVQVYRVLTIQAVASATADTTINLPFGARFVGLLVEQNVAPTGATVTVQLGTTLGGAQLVAAVDIKTNIQTITSPVLGATSAPLASTSALGAQIFLRINQGTPTAVGNFSVFINYVIG